MEKSKIRSYICKVLGHNFINVARHKTIDVHTNKPKVESTAWRCVRCGRKVSHEIKYPK